MVGVLTTFSMKSCPSRDLVVGFRPDSRYLMESINFPLTKSRCVLKDEDISRKKIGGNLGRVVVRNMQPILLTPWSPGSRVSEGNLSAPLFAIHQNIFSKKTGMTKFVGSAICIDRNTEVHLQNTCNHGSTSVKPNFF